MNPLVPAAADVRRELLALSHAQLQRLAQLSAVPFGTLWKIRDGTTKNPGIETVRTFLEWLPMLAEPHHQSSPAQASAGGGANV